MEEEEVVLGLIPAPDWVENRPLEEGGEIELAVAKKLQHYKESDQIMEIKPKKEKDSIEEITLDSEGEESQKVKMKPEEFKIEADNPFHTENERAEIETAEQNQRVPVPIVFSAGQEGGEISVKQEEELQIDESTEFPEAEEGGEISVKQEEELQIDVATEFPEGEENEEETMHAEEEPHIEAVTVFSDSDEGESIQIKEEEELQIEAVTVYSDTEQSEEESLLGQENERYNVQNSGGNPFTLSVAHPQPTIVETAVQDVYGCNSCPKSFSCTAELSKHVRSHPPRGKPFICRVCLKTDSLAANLKRHMRTHSGEKPYSCVVCFKMFTSAYSLKIHMRIHSGYKPYPCKKCPRAFYQKTDLNKHNVVHLRAETVLQATGDLPEKRDSNPLEKKVEMSNLTEKVLSQCENSRMSNLTPGVSHYVLSPQLTVVPVKINSKTDESRIVNSQTESPSNVLRDMPIITDVVGSFHEEDNEMQPCLSPKNSRRLQKQVEIQPSKLAEKQIKMEKTVYSQPVINLVNSQVANSTGALQDTATPVSSPGGKQLAVKKSVYEQQEAYSSEEDSLSGQENIRYNVQDNSANPSTLYVARPLATVIETVVQNVYGCNTCFTSFPCTEELVKHVQSHPPKRKPFVCRVCLKTDSFSYTFEKHMLTHSKGKSYRCVLCFTVFTTAYSLKIHMRIHSGYKPYSCKKCPRTFYQKTDLNKHNADHVRAKKILKDAEESKSPKKMCRVLKAKVLPQCENSQVSNVLPGESQLSVVPVNENLKTVNSQNESPPNILCISPSPSPFKPVNPEVAVSDHEENTEIQPCPSLSNNRLLQEQVALQPTSSAENQSKMEKVVYSQPVMNSENLQVTVSTGALQDNDTPVDRSAGKELSVKESVYEQSEAHSVSSQNEVNLGTTVVSPVQLPTDVVQNNSNLAASALNTTFLNNFMPSQPGGEMFCIPMIINGQMGYMIPAHTAFQLVINNPTPVQIPAQPITSHTVSAQETFLFPAFVPPILNGVPSTNFSQPTAIPTVTPQTSVLANAIPNHPQHQVGLQFPRVSNVTPVWPENSCGPQMTVMNTVPYIQSENSTGSQMTYMVPIPHGQVENSLESQMITMKTDPDIWPENSLGSQITTMGMSHMANWKNPWGPR